MTDIDPQTRAGVASRGRVYTLMTSDLPAALAEARSNPHPWYRCQSLATVAADVTDPTEAARILEEALEAAREQEEPNRIVSVAAWPISEIVRRSLGDVSEVITELLDVISREPNPVRRGDALLLLLEAVMPDPRLREIVLEPLLHACTTGHGWKCRRILQHTALAVATANRKLAEQLMARIPESRESRRGKDMLKKREWLGPHRFLPSYHKR